jgi:hypothetical protein
MPTTGRVNVGCHSRSESDSWPKPFGAPDQIDRAGQESLGLGLSSSLVDLVAVPKPRACRRPSAALRWA